MNHPTPERIEQVRAVLTQPHRSCVDLGAELSVSATWVRKVRRGIWFRDLLPELPRQTEAQRLSTSKAEDFVRDVLLHGMPEADAAAKYGVTLSAARRVATGRLYSSVLPELPRRQLLRSHGEPVFKNHRHATCYDCRLFGNDACSLGFPEAQNHKAAIRCAAFWDKNEVACYDAVAA